MKKIIIIVLLVFITGCVSEESSYYDNVIEETSLIEESTELPCNVEVNVTSIVDGDIYYITFDEPTVKMLNIKALVMGGEDVTSIGFLDNPVNMEEGNIDKENNYVKGVILSGVVSDEVLKIYIEYEDEFGELVKSYYIHQI